MKKSIQANISGRIYNIDEDAYELLNSYITELRSAFNTADGLEVVSDIEARIAEIFASRTDTIIVIDDVNEVIERMGKPGQIAADYPDMSASAQTPPPYQANSGETKLFTTERRKFYRSTTDRVFGGVLGGVAAYFDWNTTLLRVLVVIFALCTAVWPCVVCYLVAWMVVPEARTARQRLEQMGERVTIDQLGNQVLVENARRDDREHISLSGVFGKCVMAFVGFVALSIISCMVIGSFKCFGHGITSFCDLDGLGMASERGFGYLLGGLVCLSVMVPSIVVAWMASHVLFKLKGPRPWVWVTAGIIEVVIFTAITAIIIYYDKILL